MKKINLFNRNIDLPSYRRKPVFRGFNRGGGIPAFAGMTKKIYGMTAVIFALFVATPSFAETTAQDLLDKKTVVSKYYVDQELETKQDTISIDKVLLYGADGKVFLEDIYVPAIVVTNDAGTQLNGNTIGVLDYSSYNTLEGNFGIFRYFTDSSYDNFIPTVRAVANALNDILGLFNYNLNFGADETTATNNYSISFSGQNGNWPQNDYDRLVRGGAFAGGLALKQNIIPAGTAGRVVTYTGTAGQVGSKTVSSAATYNGTTLTNGGDIANIAAVETKQDKMTCAGYEPGHEGDEDYCWLYNVNNSAAVGGQNCVGYNGKVPDIGGQSQCCSGVIGVCDKVNGCHCGCANDSDCPGSNVCDTSTRVCTDNSTGGKI